MITKLVLFHALVLVAQAVKNLPAIQENQVQSLGQEDPLEKDMATHSSFLAWRIPRTEEPGGLQFMGSQSWTRLSTATRVHIYMYVCIPKPRDVNGLSSVIKS